MPSLNGPFGSLKSTIMFNHQAKLQQQISEFSHSCLLIPRRVQIKRLSLLTGYACKRTCVLNVVSK